MKRMLFVYNQHAGKGMLKNRISDIVDCFIKAGYEVTIHPTQALKDAYYKIKDFDKNTYDQIVCAGGDGTLDEVVSGMMMRKERVPIGYIPAGTTNDFANSLKIPSGFLKAAENAVYGYPFPCDIGQFNGDYFVYVAAFGLFTDVSYETKQEIKNVLGHMAYILEGTKRLFNINSYPLKVKCAECEVEDEFLFGMVTNSRSIGGFRSMVGSSVHFDDGEFEVTLIKTPKNPLELQETIAALLVAQPDEKRMYTFRSGHIEFESDKPIPWTLDGEYGGSHDKVEITNQKQALQFMVEEKNVKRLSKK